MKEEPLVFHDRFLTEGMDARMSNRLEMLESEETNGEIVTQLVNLFTNETLEDIVFALLVNAEILVAEDMKVCVISLSLLDDDDKAAFVNGDDIDDYCRQTIFYAITRHWWKKHGVYCSLYMDFEARLFFDYKRWFSKPSEMLLPRGEMEEKEEGQRMKRKRSEHLEERKVN